MTSFYDKPFRPYITSRVGVVHNGPCKAVDPEARRKYLTDKQLLVYRAKLSACPACIGSAAWVHLPRVDRNGEDEVG